MKYFSEKKLLKYLIKLVENSKTINPQSPFKLTWDCINIMIICTCLFFIPIEFLVEKRFIYEYGDSWYTTIVLIICFFIIDIFVKLNTGVFWKGIILSNKARIGVIYLK